MRTENDCDVSAWPPSPQPGFMVNEVNQPMESYSRKTQMIYDVKLKKELLGE